MDVVMKEQLVEAGMDEQQADVLVAHLPDWSQTATKADLKDLDQKSQGQMLDLKAQMQDLKTDLKAQMQDLKTDLKDQMLGLKTDLQGQIAAMKSSLAWQLWLPVAVIVITILADRFTKVTPS